MEPVHFTLPDPDQQGTHRIAGMECGAGPVAVCVHGLTRNARDFSKLMQALAPYYRIMALDVPGRGQSDWLKQAAWYNYGTYVADFLGLMEQRKLQGVHWIGTSMGGLIGMMIAASQPSRISKLVLNDIGPFVPADSLRRIGSYVGQKTRFSTREEAETHVRLTLAPFNLTDPEEWRQVIESSLAQEQDGGWRLDYDPGIGAIFRDEEGKLKSFEDVDLWALWEKISCPILLLRGETSDVLTKPVAERMLATKPGTAYVEFPIVGHAPALLSEEQIRPIGEWLRK